MKIIGLIAEYNPFHNGHLYQIKKIKELYKNSLLIVILNGNFTQRGETSIINKWNKTRIILDYGVDLVIELPIFYGINNADIFAKGAIEILNDLKIDTLVFGSESNDIDKLKNIASLKINNKKYDNKLKEELKNGISYPKASFNAIKSLSGLFTDKPNDILGIAYIEEILKNNYNIEPITIKRTNDYHSNEINKISSASAIRNGLKNNIDISNSVPKKTLKYLNNTIFIDDFFELLKYKILSEKNLNIFHGIEEGIENRINKYILESNNLEELIQKIKCKRYTYNRIKRILLYILLDIKKEDIKNIKNYIRPLGFNKKGSRYLKKIKKEITLPLVNNYIKNKGLLYLEHKSNYIYSLKSNKFYNEIKEEYNKPIIKGNEL